MRFATSSETLSLMRIFPRASMAAVASSAMRRRTSGLARPAHPFLENVFGPIHDLAVHARDTACQAWVRPPFVAPLPFSSFSSLGLPFRSLSCSRLRSLFTPPRTGLVLLGRDRSFPCDPFLLLSVSLVVAVLVAHVPSGQDHHAGRQALLLASLFGVFDIKIHVVQVLGFSVILTLKLVGPRCVVLDHGVKVVEEFPIGIHTGSLHLGADTPNLFRTEGSNLLQFCEAAHHLFEGLIQIQDFSEQSEFHGCSSPLRCGSLSASPGGFGYCRSHSRCSSGVKNRTLGGFPSTRRRSSTTFTSR